MSELAQLARDFFDYKDGQLIRKKFASSNAKAGARAGSLRRDGYRDVQLEGKKYLEHRLIYQMHNPDWDITDTSQKIDHINMMKDDNCIENLRLVTHQENTFNTDARGYYWDKINKKWHAQIKVNGKLIHLGRFTYATDARLAYLEAKKKYHIIEERTHG